jgi:hypothetical protein
MAAGLGFKTFTTGEVLTAGDVNGYLMQGILVFASAAARTAAITSPQEGQYSFLKDTNALEYYDGAGWVGAPVGDITAVTAGTGISGGGSSGDVTITNSMATAIDAKGDLVPGTGADTFARLAVGANGTILTADSGETTGMKWAANTQGMTLLSTTTLSGASTTISSINQTYKNLRILIYNVANSTADGNFTIKHNGYSDSQYITQMESSTFYVKVNSFYSTGIAVARTDVNNCWDITIGNYATTSAGFKSVNGAVVYIGTGSAQRSGSVTGGWYAAGVGISSLTFANTGGNFAGGTVELYGVN